MSDTEVAATAEERKPGWLELFYDLAVVAALAASNDSFIEDPTVESGIFAVLSLAALFSFWLLTSLVHNRFPVDGLLYRVLLLIQMSGILLAAVALNAGTSTSWRYGLLAMAIALVTISCMFALAWVRVRQPVPGIRVSIISPLLGAAACLVALALPREQLAWSLTAVIAITLVPIFFTLSKNKADVFRIHANHLRERLGLLLLIAIGEGFIQLVARMTNATQGVDYRLFALVMIFNFSIAAFYFDDVFAEHKKPNPRAWRTTVFAHFLLLVGVGAAADEMAIFAGSDSSIWPPDSAGLFALAIGALLVGLTILEWNTLGRLAPLDIAQCLLAAGVIGYGVIEIAIQQSQTRAGVFALTLIFIAWALLRVGLKLRNTRSRVAPV